MQIAMLAADFTRRRGRCAAPRDGGVEAARRPRAVPRAAGRPHGREGLRRSNTPSASSSRSRASANTASRRATPPASRCSPTSAAGSSATTPTPSCAACSTPADGLLRAGAAGARRARARRRGAAGRRARSATGRARWKAGLPSARAAPRGRPARPGPPLAGAPRPQPRQGPGRRRRRAHRRGARRGAASPAPKTWRGAPASTRHALAVLAEADALQGLTGHRHQAAWAVAGIDTRPTEMLRATRVARGARSCSPRRAKARRRWPTTARSA